MSEPLDAALGRLGYVRTDVTTNQAMVGRVDAVDGADVEQATYPQVVMIQGRSTGESWVRDHAGQLLLAAGVGVFGLTALAVVALVAILVTVAMVTCTTALVIAKAAISQPSRRGRK